MTFLDRIRREGRDGGTEQIELSVLRRGQSAFLLLLRSEVVDTPVSGVGSMYFHTKRHPGLVTDPTLL